MIEKYEDSLRENVKKLKLHYNLDFNPYIENLISNKNDDSINTLCKIIYTYLKNNESNKKKVKEIYQLYESIVKYVGYIKIKEVFNTMNNNDSNSKSTLNQMLDELDHLVGLSKVKETVNDLIAYQAINKLRREKGLKINNNTLHMAFLGNPGTGKTTVARIISKVYKHLGLLSKGHFIEVSRTDLIAGYQGQTALKVKEVIEKAKGGVLFIDEAYSITENQNSDSYGRECLTELTKALEDYREDLVVIVAGYTDLMNNFFDSNPGIKSRFNKFSIFDDYSIDELIEIIYKFAKDNNYILSDSLLDLIKDHLTSIKSVNTDEFSNARYMRNIFDNLVMNHARRVFKIEEPTTIDLQKIIDSDFTLE